MKRSKLKYKTEENRKKVCLRKTFTKNKKQCLDNLDEKNVKRE